MQKSAKKKKKCFTMQKTKLSNYMINIPQLQLRTILKQFMEEDSNINS